MQVILKPLSHPDLDEIVIKDRLFAIGRQEQPFVGYAPDIVAKLSRRHARIFEQDDRVYLVDLDSLNGTTINGDPLDKQPRQLHQNDQICFAGHLTYNIQLLGSSAKSLVVGEKLPSVILTLIPAQSGSLLEPIVVSEFPYLISKSDDTFARYRDQLADEYEFLSRRHAHIYTRDQTLLVEDLGSTNGTFVSGNRLDEKKRILHENDTIAFGGNYFLYKVHIKLIEREPGIPLDDPSLLTDALNTSTEITRTTFVTSANSFIDIFCLEEDERGSELESDDIRSRQIVDGKGKTHKGNNPPNSGTNQPNRLSIFINEFRRAFSEGQQLVNRKIRWPSIALLVLLMGLLGYSYYQGAPKRAIQELLNEGKFSLSAERADNYLADHPQDKEVEEWSTEAVLRSSIPGWQQNLYANRYQQARLTINAARSINTHNHAIVPLLDMMEWIIALEQFFHERGGALAPILIFNHEKRIQEIIDWWDDNSGEHQRQVRRIANLEPLFEDTQARVLSHLRTLRSEKSLYLNAIDEFKQTLQVRLERNELDELDLSLTDFTNKYPRISGLNWIKEDLLHYRLLRDAMNRRDWVRAIDLSEDAKYSTPPFQDMVAMIRSTQLPPIEIAMQYQQADDLWKAGEVDQSNRILRTLSQGEWGTMANERLQSQLAIWDRLQSLAGNKTSSEYEKQIAQLFVSLDPTVDSYFINSLKPEFEVYREKSLKMADRLFNEAQIAWDNYQKNGRILGLQRLEAKISKLFRDQAKELSIAHDRTQHATETYRRLNTDVPTKRLELHQAILRECRLQIRSMRELRLVLEPKLLQDKLNLLPNPDSKS